MISLIRGIIKKVKAEAKRLARFDATGRIGEEFTDRLMVQQYGFSSSPKDGAECLLLRSGNNIYMIASDDRRYRIALKGGEVALYDDNGSVIHLQNGGKIVIESKTEIVVKSDKVTVESGKVFLGGESGAGVLTENSIINCPYTTSLTGTPTPHVLTGCGSSSVKAAL